MQLQCYVLRVRTKGGKSALFIAAENGYTEIVRLLLKAGTNADQALDDGTTALMAAAAKNFVAIAKMLIEFGASPSVQTKVRASPASDWMIYCE